MKKVNVAIIGLGFGADFIPIYQNHPDSELYAICRRSPEELRALGDKYGVKNRFTDYRDILKDKNVDAVHVVTPLGTHAKIVLECLDAGKHVACTVPMAESVEDCVRIIEARRKVNKVYMMMETAVYTREFLFVKNLVQTGKLGKIQFMRGCHQQNMDDWPAPWPGFPPMYYGTHAISPLVRLANADVESVVCFGSGRIREHYIKHYGSPFAVETVLLRFRNSNLAAEATRSLYDVIRQYIESFDVYGTNLSFEWNVLSNEKPILFSGKEDATRVEIPDSGYLLPKEIAKFARAEGVFDDQEKSHLSFVQGAGHGGSHPHLVHEFVRAIVEGRDSEVDVETAASITCAGICAHESAMSGGERVYLPTFRKTG